MKPMSPHDADKIQVVLPALAAKHAPTAVQHMDVLAISTRRCHILPSTLQAQGLTFSVPWSW